MKINKYEKLTCVFLCLNARSLFKAGFCTEGEHLPDNHE